MKYSCIFVLIWKHYVCNIKKTSLSNPKKEKHEKKPYFLFDALEQYIHVCPASQHYW
jgi:hypothetical protein